MAISSLLPSLSTLLHHPTSPLWWLTRYKLLVFLHDQPCTVHTHRRCWLCNGFEKVMDSFPLLALLPLHHPPPSTTIQPAHPCCLGGWREQLLLQLRWPLNPGQQVFRPCPCCWWQGGAQIWNEVGDYSIVTSVVWMVSILSVRVLTSISQTFPAWTAKSPWTGWSGRTGSECRITPPVVIFKVWKHLDKQIATGNSFKCLQAFDVNVTVEDTIMKEINCSIQRIKEFSILNKI